MTRSARLGVCFWCARVVNDPAHESARIPMPDGRIQNAIFHSSCFAAWSRMAVTKEFSDRWARAARRLLKGDSGATPS